MTNEIKLKLTIDGKDALASIQLTDENVKDLFNQFRFGKKDVDNTTSSMARGFETARNVIQGVKETLSVLNTAFRNTLGAYYEQENANVLLAQAMRTNKNFTEENYKALLDYSAELQRTTIYGDELTTTVMAQLQAMGLSVTQTKEATLQSANLAAIMGVDINTAARAMADLFNGNIGMMGRYIKGLDENIIKSGNYSAILEMLNKAIGGQAVALGDTAYGATIKYKNAIGDIQENTGELLQKGLNPFLKVITDIVTNLNNANPVISGMIGGVATLTGVFITLRVTGIVPAISSMNLFAASITTVKGAMMRTGLLALVVALGYGLGKLSEAYSQWSDATDKRDQAFNRDLIKIEAETLSIEQLKESIKQYNQELEKTEKIEADTTNAMLLKAATVTDLKKRIEVFEKTLKEKQATATPTIPTLKVDKIEMDELPEITSDETPIIDLDFTDQFTAEANTIIEESEKLERLRIDAIQNEFDRQRALAEFEKQLAIEKYGELESIEIEYRNKLKEIDTAENEWKFTSTQDVLDRTKGLFSKHTAAYKAMAIAQTTIETWRAATAALSPPPIGAGPLLGSILAAVTVATGLANVAKIAGTNVEGFAEGGMLPKGKTGFIEGYYNEIIAPERTFVDVLNQNIIPKLSINNGNQAKEFKMMFDELKQWSSKIDSWQEKLTVINKMDDLDYNLTKYQQLKTVREF